MNVCFIISLYRHADQRVAAIAKIRVESSREQVVTYSAQLLFLSCRSFRPISSLSAKNFCQLVADAVMTEDAPYWRTGAFSDLSPILWARSCLVIIWSSSDALRSENTVSSRPPPQVRRLDSSPLRLRITETVQQVKFDYDVYDNIFVPTCSPVH
ncbi:hypothetical protein NEOLEDRAFT_719892 [Neolentinus lepideus HHB14362 ss-1]|uniref:Uncharacterized protein n=1 Tax=Neolentinus lepideus HHB14362 ss-1 TaxID=1314782 RepID=A0A165Q601_9AGAM|nr:hypothetical protein NEOLEDRAFT_719892 [Neolentinus lepideus HHB14362 ss-1]